MRFLVTILLALVAVVPAVAQKKIGKGQASGSFESTSIYYMDDKKLGAAPEDHFGSNNYMKVDYANGRFSAGLQANAFLPVLQGYDDLADGFKFYLASKYIQWRDKNYEILVGDIFDQYGNGLIYRSFEDRQLGFNNSIEGVRGAYSFGRYVSLKGMYGRPRLNTDYAKSWVRGADLVVSLADICGIQEKATLSIEGSYVNRFQKLTLGDNYDKIRFEETGMNTPNLNMYSGRLNFGWAGLSLRGEYVHKSKDLAPNAEKAASGSAIFGEVGYSYDSFSIIATYRQLSNMATRSSLYELGMANAINYLPALTRQYTYMLANLNPYQVAADGEMGGQVDICYSLRSKENRYRYWNFHANFSTFYTLKKTQTDIGKRRVMWRDINFDIERQWSKKLKTILLFSRQEISPTHGFQKEMYASNIFVGDVTYKFDRKKSLRVEVQYLYADRQNGTYNYEGDWVAGLVEFSLAPRWSFFVQDMYNIHKTKTNYYSGGFSYTYNRTRVQLSYGRNRAGYVCSGGVCRFSPAYTGVSLVLTSSF